MAVWAGRSSSREGLESLRVFGCLPGTGARGCTAAGVRKASREETAGEFATAVASIYGDLALVLDLICHPASSLSDPPVVDATVESDMFPLLPVGRREGWASG